MYLISATARATDFRRKYSDLVSFRYRSRMTGSWQNVHGYGQPMLEMNRFIGMSRRNAYL